MTLIDMIAIILVLLSIVALYQERVEI